MKRLTDPQSAFLKGRSPRAPNQNLTWHSSYAFGHLFCGKEFPSGKVLQQLTAVGGAGRSPAVKAFHQTAKTSKEEEFYLAGVFYLAEEAGRGEFISSGLPNQGTLGEAGTLPGCS